MQQKQDEINRLRQREPTDADNAGLGYEDDDTEVIVLGDESDVEEEEKGDEEDTAKGDQEEESGTGIKEAPAIDDADHQ